MYLKGSYYYTWKVLVNQLEMKNTAVENYRKLNRNQRNKSG